MVKVSVIIPVYNAAKYLKECLDSLVNQSLDDIEIICVNDGSTDNSLEILQEYSKNDKRFKVFSQKNQGQGTARNNALKHVNGKYFLFLDSDDKLELNTLEDCYKVCEEKYLDMVIFKLINYDEDNDEFFTSILYDMKEVTEVVENNVFNYTDLDDKIFALSVTPVNKLYSTKFVLESGVSFPEDTIFEDNIFSWNLLFKAKRMHFIDNYFYIRRVHPNSTMGSGNAKWVDAIEIYNGVWNIFQENNLFDDYKSKLYNNKVLFALYRYDNIQVQYQELFFNKWKKDLILTQDKYSDFTTMLNKNNKRTFELVLASNDSAEFNIMKRINDISNKINKMDLHAFKMNKVINNYNKLLDQKEELLLSEKEEYEILKDEYRRKHYENELLFNQKKELLDELDKRNDDIKMLLAMTENYSKDIQCLQSQNNELSYNLTNNVSNNMVDCNNQDLSQFKNEVLNSTSWKITKPLRSIGGFIRKYF